MKLPVIKLFLGAAFIVSCSKKSISNNEVQPPSGLTLTADVSADSTGNVSFEANAVNATSFEFDFGDGTFDLSTSGRTSHRYAVSGVYAVNVIARNNSAQNTSKSMQVQVVRNYRLVWSDEFDAAGAPQSSNWGYDIGTGSGGWGNNELQYYTNRAANVIVSNGTLKINAVRETYNGSEFTSARLLSKDRYSFRYGKIEARAKLPSGIGTWPAIWMLGGNIGSVSWPACGEIDIMEHRGSEPGKIYSTVHYPGHSGSGGTGSYLLNSDVSTAFHLYSAVWDASAISFYTDDRLIFRFPNNSTLPFNQPFFILLNVAMGGNFGGVVDPAFTGSTMEIDYIRVYN